MRPGFYGNFRTSNRACYSFEVVGLFHGTRKAMMTQISIITARKTNGIQSGESTHHHDHAITPQSLRVMNTISRTVPADIPDVFELLI